MCNKAIDIEEVKMYFASNEDYMGKPAERLAILAAIQKGRLYTPGISNDIRTRIRRLWGNLLISLGEKYASAQQTEDTFKKDIESLKTSMNSEMNLAYFQNAHQEDGYEAGFRLSHAQKSLSVYLKHLWCSGELNGFEPPVCPIDRVILNHVCINDSWLKVNHMNVYETHLNSVKKAAHKAGYSSVAEWELVTWKSDADKNSVIENNYSGDRISNNLIKIEEKNLREKRELHFGYKISTEEGYLYLFVGEKPTFTYCEILTESNERQISEYPFAVSLYEEGVITDEGGLQKDYIYKKFEKGDYASALETLVEALRYFN